MKKQTLRIGVLASNLIRIPPRPSDIPSGFSGAPEMIVHAITEGLVRKGHDVTLFASGDSDTRATLVSVTDRALSTNPEINTTYREHFMYELLLVSKAFEMAKNGRFDIIHNHLDTLAAYFTPLVETPTVSTYHSLFTKRHIDILKCFSDSQYIVSISDAQRRPAPYLRWAATIHHGIDGSQIPWSADPRGNYAVVVGRISHQKGIFEAILAARMAHINLIILGSHLDDAYWNESVKPHIDGNTVIYKDFVPQDEMFRIYKDASVLLAPIQWEEPFGLVMIEAMACATPVIAFRRGSVPEIVEHGKTGFIADTVEEMAAYIGRIGEIDRRECRNTVEERFSLDRMIDSYENVFLKIAATTH